MNIQQTLWFVTVRSTLRFSHNTPLAKIIRLEDHTYFTLLGAKKDQFSVGKLAVKLHCVGFFFAARRCVPQGFPGGQRLSIRLRRNKSPRGHVEGPEPIKDLKIYPPGNEQQFAPARYRPPEKETIVFKHAFSGARLVSGRVTQWFFIDCFHELFIEFLFFSLMVHWSFMMFSMIAPWFSHGFFKMVPLKPIPIRPQVPWFHSFSRWKFIQIPWGQKFQVLRVAAMNFGFLCLNAGWWTVDDRWILPSKRGPQTPKIVINGVK